MSAHTHPSPQTTLQAAIQGGIANGLLPDHTTAPTSDARPWPVVLLTAIGAWFAAIPLLFAVGLLLGDAFRTGPGPYIIGCLVLAGAVVVLRAKDLPLFVEQLAVPALLVGGGTLAMGVYRDLPDVGGALVMLLVVTSVTAVVPKNWLRVLLGSAAAGLLCQVLLPNWGWWRGRMDVLMVLHGLLVVWLAALRLQERSVAVATLIEAMATGWLLTTLVGLAWVAGATFMVGGAVGSSEVGSVLMWASGHGARSWQTYGMQMGSSVLVLVAAAVGALAWPALRQLLPALVALVLAVLAWFMPMLGAVLLALVVCATTHRWRLSAACAVAAAWIVGGFYYQLRWPLADKALLLVGAGAVLGAGTWLTFRLNQRTAPPNAQTQDTTNSHTTTTRTPRLLHAGTATAHTWTMLAGTLATLLVANAAIWQKQDLIAHGKPMYLALVPVDPRSLMQGDYMQLRFAALDAHSLPLLADLAGQRPHMVVQLDARGVATVQRMHAPGEPLGANEMLLELSPKNGNWVVVTDAWFFKEGTAEQWQAAKYGEFRVLPDGRALLVGMTDGELRALVAK
jgi:uncharacterized membrane-anchored protein